MKYLKWYDENADYCASCYNVDPEDIIYFAAPDDFNINNVSIEQFFVENNLEYKNTRSKKNPSYEYKFEKHKRYSQAIRFSNILVNYDYKSFYRDLAFDWLENKYKLERIEIPNL